MTGLRRPSSSLAALAVAALVALVGCGSAAGRAAPGAADGVHHSPPATPAATAPATTVRPAVPPSPAAPSPAPAAPVHLPVPLPPTAADAATNARVACGLGVAVTAGAGANAAHFPAAQALPEAQDFVLLAVAAATGDPAYDGLRVDARRLERLVAGPRWRNGSSADFGLPAFTATVRACYSLPLAPASP